ncbi:hypothetical protein [Nostoc sp. CALU 546]|uniref:hypothetical protein n=1 Tax=Nostoc sp. CALU 546 TaxID=1867241 RepID=UPI003B6841ED
MDENPATSLDSVLTIPEPLSAPKLKEQPANILKAAKHAAKLYSFDLIILPPLLQTEI